MNVVNDRKKTVILPFERCFSIDPEGVLTEFDVHPFPTPSWDHPCFFLLPFSCFSSPKTGFQLHQPLNLKSVKSYNFGRLLAVILRCSSTFNLQSAACIYLTGNETRTIELSSVKISAKNEYSTFANRKYTACCITSTTGAQSGFR